VSRNREREAGSGTWAEVTSIATSRQATRESFSGQENLAGWHGSRRVVRKAEAFSQAGKTVCREERKQGRHTQMQEPGQGGRSCLAETEKDRLDKQ
jgi:hypothetical protein